MKRFLYAGLIIACSSFVQTDSKYWATGEALIKSLRAQAPKFEGVPLRDYSYRDLNYDNQYEIIEAINKTEEEATGLLNAELAPAFELHRIYTYSGGKFQKNYKPFGNYLEQRIIFYRFWKRQIESPAQLSEDSKALIKENKLMFLKELERLIGLMEKLQA